MIICYNDTAQAAPTRAQARASARRARPKRLVEQSTGPERPERRIGIIYIDIILYNICNILYYNKLPPRRG